jgi:hypothetical protein
MNVRRIGLTVIPRGRGNWNLISLEVAGPFDLFAFKPGTPLDIGGRQFWIREVRQ